MTLPTCDDCGGPVRIVLLFRGTAAERPVWFHSEPIVGMHSPVVDGQYDPPEIGA